MECCWKRSQVSQIGGTVNSRSKTSTLSASCFPCHHFLPFPTAAISNIPYFLQSATTSASSHNFASPFTGKIETIRSEPPQLFVTKPSDSVLVETNFFSYYNAREFPYIIQGSFNSHSKSHAWIKFQGFCTLN
jgi:hypothetical protein